MLVFVHERFTSGREVFRVDGINVSSEAFYELEPEYMVPIGFIRRVYVPSTNVHDIIIADPNGSMTPRITRGPIPYPTGDRALSDWQDFVSIDAEIRSRS